MPNERVLSLPLSSDEIIEIVLQEAVKAITDACGKEFVPQFDAAGNPVCAVKAAEPKAGDKK